MTIMLQFVLAIKKSKSRDILSKTLKKIIFQGISNKFYSQDKHKLKLNESLKKSKIKINFAFILKSYL